MTNVVTMYELSSSEQNYFSAELRSCVKVEVAVLGSRPTVSVHVTAGRTSVESIPLLRLSFLFKKVLVWGHCLVTSSITSY